MEDLASKRDDELFFKKYQEKFSRKIPFPRLEVEEIIMNPVLPQYFYLIKTQAIDKNFEIRNFITEDDKYRIEQKIETMRERGSELSDDESSDENFDYRGDLFEQALNKMRQEKDFNLDFEGITKAVPGLSIVTRGTRSSNGSYFGHNKNRDEPEEGELGELNDQQAQKIITEHAESSEITPDSEGQAASINKDSELSDEENGESEPDEAEADEESKEEYKDKKEEQKLDFRNLATGPEHHAVGENKVQLSKIQSVNVGQSDLKNKINMPDMVQDANLLIPGQQPDKQMKDKKAEENEDEEDEEEEKQEEEKFTVEQVRFSEYKNPNNGKILKQKPKVLICCILKDYGYAIEQKLYCDADETVDNFQFTDHIFFSACGRFLGTRFEDKVKLYKATNLELVSEIQLDLYGELNVYDLNTLYLSSDCKYLCAVTYYNYYFFSGKTGYQHSFIPREGKDFKGFINRDSILGTKYELNNEAISLCKYNVESGRMEEDFRTLDAYYDSMIINEKGKACVMEKDSNLYYYDIDNKDGPHKILENIDFLKEKNINGDCVSVLYTEESKTYFSLYEKNKLIFRKKLDLGSNSINSYISCNDQKKIIYVEKQMANKVIYMIDEANLTDVSFQFSIKYHFPYIFYDYEKHEVWIQRIDFPNEIRRYIFINTISAFDHTDNVFFKDNYQNKAKYHLGMILTYENHHKIAELDFSTENAILTRIQRPIKFTELPQANILSFVQIEGKNDKNKLEPCVVFHYLTQLKFYFLKTGKIKKHHD